MTVNTCTQITKLSQGGVCGAFHFFEEHFFFYLSPIPLNPKLITKCMYFFGRFDELCSSGASILEVSTFAQR